MVNAREKDDVASCWMLLAVYLLVLSQNHHLNIDHGLILQQYAYKSIKCIESPVNDWVYSSGFVLCSVSDDREDEKKHKKSLLRSSGNL